MILALENKYHDKIDFIIADVDQEKELTARFQVYSIPAFFFIGKNGNIVENKVGYIPHQEMDREIIELLDK